MLTILPFSGFYESLHDGNLDDAIERMFADTNGDVLPGMTEHAISNCNWRQVHEAYAKDYTERFAIEHEVALVYESLHSPREYNFTTDRIFATIELAEVERMFNEVDIDRLEEFVKETFTRRSGFIPSYSNDVHSWGPLDKWDANQVGTLLVAWIDHDWEETYLMDGAMENGYMENWIAGAIPNISRLYRIQEYLIKRGNR